MGSGTDEARIEALLREKRRRLTDELDGLTRATPRDPLAAVSFGKRVGDGTTEAVERLNATAAARSLAALAHEVDGALERLAEGRYGTCDRCGRIIPPERLEAIPWTSTCVACAARA